MPPRLIGYHVNIIQFRIRNVVNRWKNHSLPDGLDAQGSFDGGRSPQGVSDL
jgi:hypothetical protein